MTETKRKVCFFSGDITRSGGTERVAVLIAGQIALRKKWEVVFLSIVEQRETMFFEPVLEIPRYVLSESKKWITPGPGYIPLVPRLRKFIKEKQIDVMVDIDVILDLLTVPAMVGQNIKLIAWEHFHYHYEWPSPVYRKFRKISSHLTARYADYIVTLTEQDTENYQKELGRKENISAIYNPMEFIGNLQEEIKRENILITVGRLTRVKGIDLLVKIIPEILKRHKDWKWYVLGEGEERELLEQICEMHHLQEQLILTGNVPDVEVYLQRASIYVMTSRAEGLPMCLLEAMACGVACVSFDIQTGPAEIIEDGENGFLIPAFDLRQMEEKIELLIEDRFLRQKFSNNTAKNKEKFDLHGITDQWEVLLERMFSGNKRK